MRAGTRMRTFEMAKVRFCRTSPSGCPLCYEGRKGRVFHKGHFGYRKSRKASCVSMARFLQESSKNGTIREISESVPVCAIGELHPCLWEYLTLTAWESGKPRTTATLLAFVEEGKFKICLNDRENQRAAWVSGATFTEAIDRLEAALIASEAEWRRAKVGVRK